MPHAHAYGLSKVLGFWVSCRRQGFRQPQTIRVESCCLRTPFGSCTMECWRLCVACQGNVTRDLQNLPRSPLPVPWARRRRSPLAVVARSEAVAGLDPADKPPVLSASQQFVARFQSDGVWCASTPDTPPRAATAASTLPGTVAPSAQFSVTWPIAGSSHISTTTTGDRKITLRLCGKR